MIFFETDETDYTIGNIDYIDTAASGESRVLVPIPAPAALPLAFLGMVVAGHLRRKKAIR